MLLLPLTKMLRLYIILTMNTYMGVNDDILDPLIEAYQKIHLPSENQRGQDEIFVLS